MVQVTNGIGSSGKEENNISPRQLFCVLVIDTLVVVVVFVLTVNTDIIAKLQKQPPPSHKNHHAQALSWEGNKGNSTLFLGVNGDALQVFVEKPPWV